MICCHFRKKRSLGCSLLNDESAEYQRTHLINCALNCRISSSFWRIITFWDSMTAISLSVFISIEFWLWPLFVVSWSGKLLFDILPRALVVGVCQSLSSHNFWMLQFAVRIGMRLCFYILRIWNPWFNIRLHIASYFAQYFFCFLFLIARKFCLSLFRNTERTSKYSKIMELVLIIIISITLGMRQNWRMHDYKLP